MSKVNYYIFMKLESSSVKNGHSNAKKAKIHNKVIIRISNEVQQVQLYPTHLLARGYFYTQNEKYLRHNE